MSLTITKEVTEEVEVNFWEIPNPHEYFHGLTIAEQDELLLCWRDYNRCQRELKTLCEINPIKKHNYIGYYEMAVKEIEREIKKILGGRVKFT